MESFWGKYSISFGNVASKIPYFPRLRNINFQFDIGKMRNSQVHWTSRSCRRTALSSPHVYVYVWSNQSITGLKKYGALYFVRKLLELDFRIHGKQNVKISTQKNSFFSQDRFYLNHVIFSDYRGEIMSSRRWSAAGYSSQTQQFLSLTRKRKSCIEHPLCLIKITAGLGVIIFYFFL